MMENVRESTTREQVGLGSTMKWQHLRRKWQTYVMRTHANWKMRIEKKWGIDWTICEVLFIRFEINSNALVHIDAYWNGERVKWIIIPTIDTINVRQSLKPLTIAREKENRTTSTSPYHYLSMSPSGLEYVSVWWWQRWCTIHSFDFSFSFFGSHNIIFLSTSLINFVHDNVVYLWMNLHILVTAATHERFEN